MGRLVRSPPLALLALHGAPAADLRAERSSAVPAHPDDKTIVHVLNRAAFGPRPGDVARVRQMGLEAWIESQLQPDRIPDGASRRGWPATRR